MASILNVDKVRATGSTNDALTVDSFGVFCYRRNQSRLATAEANIKL